MEVIALAKSKSLKTGDTQQPHHSEERIFRPGIGTSFPLKSHSVSFRLITHIRDEAHRFAITHHRRRRKSVRHKSKLELIKGVGPSLRKQLLAQFGSLHGIATAEPQALAAIKGITIAKAQTIIDFLQQYLNSPDSESSDNGDSSQPLTE